MPIITVLAPKGGVGKSTIAANLLAAAVKDGIAAAGLDLDSQGSLTGWAETRATAGIEPTIAVTAAEPGRWRTALPRPLAIVDTAPGIGSADDIATMRDLALASDLVLVPTLPEGPTLARLADLAADLADEGARVLFVLNRVRKGRVRLAQSRAFLAERGELCPVEIPDREHVHWATDAGRAAVEDPGGGAAAEMAALWAFVRARLP